RGRLRSGQVSEIALLRALRRTGRLGRLLLFIQIRFRRSRYRSHLDGSDFYILLACLALLVRLRMSILLFLLWNGSPLVQGRLHVDKCLDSGIAITREIGGRFFREICRRTARLFSFDRYLNRPLDWFCLWKIEGLECGKGIFRLGWRVFGLLKGGALPPDSR